MAKTKKENDPVKPPYVSRHLNPKLVFHLPQELLDALNGFLDTLNPPPPASGVLRVALEEYLERKGHWPKGGKKN
jgi:hypothetical protein